MSAATVMPKMVQNEAVLLRFSCTCSPTQGPTAMPMDTVKAKRLIPSVTFAAGRTSPAIVIVAEAQTEYTAPMYSRTTMSSPNNREGDERRKGQAEQREENDIYLESVEVVQQITGHGPEQHRRHAHGGQHDADLRASDAYLLTVDGDDWDGRVECRQHQQVSDE